MSGSPFTFLAPPQQPDELGHLGSYRVMKVLGQGGMGMVFQAEDVRLGRLVALKVMLPELAQKAEARTRFLAEARAAATIEHDHIVAIYQVDEDRGVPFIAMPLLKGMSLEDWLKGKQQGTPPTRLSFPQVLKIGREIARGLAAAHDQGLIHRDIKPANVWLDATAGGRVKILDFGLARVSTGQQNLTQSGAIIGTPAYMAPEQARCETVDARADLFSLGVVLYRLCTGQLPFQGKDVVSTLMAVVGNEPAAPRQVNPDLPPALSDLVMRLLEKDPTKRLGSAQEVVTAIQAVEKDLRGSEATAESRTQLLEGRAATGSVPRPASAVAVNGSKRRRGLRMAAAALFILVGGGALLTPVILRIGHPDGKTEEVPVEPVAQPEPKPDGKPKTAVDKANLGEKPNSALAVAGDSVFDRLRREDIPPAKLKDAGQGDPKKAPPEIVAIYGESRSKTPILGFALHPNGKTLAGGFGGENRVKLLDLSTGQIRPWSASGEGPTPACFSHDGKDLAVIMQDRQPTSLWDTATGKARQMLTDSKHAKTYLAFSPDDREIFCLVAGHNLQRQWVAGRVDLGAPPPAPLENANYPMGAFALSPDGSFFAAASYTTYESCYVQIWEVRTGKLLGKTNEKMRGAHGLFFSPDSKLLAQIHAYRTDIPVYDVTTRKQRGKLKLTNGDTTTLAFHPKAKLAVSADRYGVLNFWDTTTFANTRILNLKPPTSGDPNHGGVTQLLFAPDGRHLLTRNGDGTVYVLRLAAAPQP
jgi:hypothetical protein